MCIVVAYDYTTQRIKDFIKSTKEDKELHRQKKSQQNNNY